MAMTASTPITLAQNLLNDRTGVSYTPASLVPLCQKAYRELQIKMSKAGLSVKKEISPSITVPANTTQIIDGDGLMPIDLLYPITLFERGSSNELWQLMDEDQWEPNTDPGVTLSKWTWREEQIHLIGSTTVRYLQIQYAKGLPEITSATSPVNIIDSDLFLASRTAAIAALVIGENPTRAAALDQDANSAWLDLKAVHVKRRQAMPVRRRVTRYRI